MSKSGTRNTNVEKLLACIRRGSTNKLQEALSESKPCPNGAATLKAEIDILRG
jgi:hypothetical protein